MPPRDYAGEARASAGVKSVYDKAPQHAEQIYCTGGKPKPNGAGAKASAHEEAHDFNNADGALLFQIKVRIEDGEPKRNVLRPDPDGSGTWIGAVAGTYTGDDENSNKLMGDHARNIRKLCDLPGRPCTVALCHPTKRPNGKDDLLPRGGGAYIAEVDGNLCLWGHDDRLADLHWTGKFRGPDFEPICFRLEPVTTTNLVDRKGKLLPTVMAQLVTEAEAVAEIEHTRNDENRLLAAMLLPGQSIAEMAAACGWMTSKGEPHKSKVDRTLKRLAADRLVAKKRGDWTLTEAGKSAANAAASRTENRDREARKYPS